MTILTIVYNLGGEFSLPEPLAYVTIAVSIWSWETSAANFNPALSIGSFMGQIYSNGFDFDEIGGKFMNLIALFIA